MLCQLKNEINAMAQNLQNLFFYCQGSTNISFIPIIDCSKSRFNIVK